MNKNRFQCDKIYKFQFLIMMLSPLFILLGDNVIGINLKDVIQIQLIVLMFVTPFLLFVYGSRVYITNKSILIKVLFFPYDIPFLDIEYFTNNDHVGVNLLSLSSERITLYLRNNKKIQISPQNIEAFRNILSEKGIPTLEKKVKIKSKKTSSFGVILFCLCTVLVTNLIYLFFIYNDTMKSAIWFIIMNFVMAVILLFLIIYKNKKIQTKK